VGGARFGRLQPSMAPEVRADEGGYETDPRKYNQRSFEVRFGLEEIGRGCDNHADAKKSEAVVGQEALGLGLMKRDPEGKTQGEAAEDERGPGHRRSIRTVGVVHRHLLGCKPAV
jgi:hypothetical protein